MANRVAPVLLLVIATFLQHTHQQQPYDPFECGLQKVNINEVILRGRDATPGEWPWHSAIYHVRGLSRSYACGGTLISPRFVLTAAHCVKGDNGYVLSSKRVLVMLGVHNLNAPNTRHLQIHEVQQVSLFKSSAQFRNDIALVEMSTEAEFGDFVQPACVTEERDHTGQLGSVAGWGYTKHDQVSPVLKMVQLPAVSTAECLESDRDTFASTLDKSLFCAGYTNGTGVCNGDSGGGLVFKKGDAWFLGGIVSYTAPREDGTNRCGTKGFAGFTNVYNFRAWIREVTGLLLKRGKGECKWRKWKLDGGRPPSGVLVGNDRDTSRAYVGRTSFEGDLTMGQYLSDSRQMFFVWGDVGRSANDFDVLTGRGFYWVKDYDGHVPYNAVAGGKTAGGDTLYVGRHKYNGDWNSGVVVPFLNGLYIGIGRQFRKYTEYEVLVHDDPSCRNIK